MNAAQKAILDAEIVKPEHDGKDSQLLTDMFSAVSPTKVSTGNRIDLFEITRELGDVTAANTFLKSLRTWVADKDKGEIMELVESRLSTDVGLEVGHPVVAGILDQMAADGRPIVPLDQPTADTIKDLGRRTQTVGEAMGLPAVIRQGEVQQAMMRVGKMLPTDKNNV